MWYQLGWAKWEAVRIRGYGGQRGQAGLAVKNLVQGRRGNPCLFCIY